MQRENTSHQKDERPEVKVAARDLIRLILFEQRLKHELDTQRNPVPPIREALIETKELLTRGTPHPGICQPDQDTAQPNLAAPERSESFALTSSDPGPVDAHYVKSSASRPTYTFLFDDYAQSLRNARLDFTNNIPNKNLKWQPTQMMGGVLGYTYLGAGSINKRTDLMFNPTLSYEVDVHESIHTEWEYETRVLTSWMLSYDPHFLKY